MPIAIFTHRATLQTSCKRQEALGTSENEPKTLSECQAFIASLLHSINPKDMILRQRDSLIATQSQAIVEVQDSLESLAEQVVPPKK